MSPSLSYEDLRNKKLQENKRKLEELKLSHLSVALRDASSPKPSPVPTHLLFSPTFSTAHSLHHYISLILLLLFVWCVYDGAVEVGEAEGPAGAAVGRGEAVSARRQLAGAANVSGGAPIASYFLFNMFM